MKVSLLVLTGLLALGLQAPAQNAEMFGYDTRRIATKTPTAASLEAFARPGVNYATGTPDIQVPVYNVVLDDELTLPITLKYNASGFKFGDVPSAAGFKWALQAGGMISRDINGMPDEEWYLPHYDEIPTYLDTMRHDGTDPGTVPQYYLQQFANNRIDMNQDYYTLHSPGGSYTLVYRNGKFYAENDNYKLKIIAFSGLQEFKVIDDKGYTYYFGGSGGGATTERTDPSHSSSPGNNDPEFNMGHAAVTSWMLRKIITPTGKEMNFEYEEYNLGYVPSGISETYTRGFVVNGSNGTPCGCPTASLTVTTNGNTYRTSLLKRISTAETEVLFSYSTNNTLTYWKQQLDSIVMKQANTGKRIRKMQFNFGSFDGIFLKLNSVDEVNVQDALDKKTWAFDYNTNTIPAFNSYSRDIYGYYNNANNNRLIVSNSTIYTQIFPSANRNPSLSRASTAMLTTMHLPTGGRVELTYELNETSARYAGGIRIQEIRRYGAGAVPADKTMYEYSGLFGGISSYTLPFDHKQLYNCDLYVFKSDYPLSERMMRNFFYSRVKEKVVSATDTIITQYDYGAHESTQGQYQPYLERQTSYLGTTGQKLREQINIYQTEEIDSLTVHTYLSLGAMTSWKAVGAGIDCYTRYPGYQEMTPATGGNHLLTATTTIDYQNTATQVTKDTMLYQSAHHRYPTERRRTGSDGVVTKEQLKYVQDYATLSSPAIAPAAMPIYDTMIARNMISPLMEKAALADTQLLQRTRAYYQVGEDNLVHPARKQLLYKDGTIQDMETYSQFQGHKLLEYSNAAGISHALVWNNYSESPIATVVNATASQVAYTSFEAGDTMTYFTYQPAQIVAGDGLTGVRSYAANGSISRANLSAAQSYIVSVWTKGGIPACNGLTDWQVGETVKGWTLRKKVVSGVSTVTISGGNGYIDEVRLYPLEAQMTTVAYDPLIGIAAMADANDQLAFYQYDGFGRLATVRDKDGSIVKQINYRYSDSTGTGQWVLTGNSRCKPCPANSSYTTGIKQFEQLNQSTGQLRWVDGTETSGCSLLADWQNTGTSRCAKNASNENTGWLETEQIDRNPCSFTFNTTRWQRSRNDTVCPVPPPPCTPALCSGNTQKCINNVCEWGTPVIVSSVFKNVNGTFQWECTTRWCFSDGTMSTHSLVTYSTVACPVGTCP